MLVCGSFSDHNLHSRGSFEVFRRAGSQHKWLYTHRDGKWSHFYGEQARDTQAAFFDHFLKGADNGWLQRSAVRLATYETGSRPVQITEESNWPPVDLAWRELYLDTAIRALIDTPAPAPGSATFRTWGPGLSLTWSVPDDLDVIGPAALRLFLELDGCHDVHLFAGLRKRRVGREHTFEGSFGFAGDMLTVGWQRAAFRDLDPELSTPQQPVHTYRDPKPLAPGEIVEVQLELLPHATRLRTGDQLRLDLAGRWLQPRNPITGQLPTGYARSPRGRVTLHTGPDHPARLLLGARPLN